MESRIRPNCRWQFILGFSPFPDGMTAAAVLLSISNNCLIQSLNPFALCTSLVFLPLRKLICVGVAALMLIDRVVFIVQH